MQTVHYGEQLPCQKWILPFVLHFHRRRRLRVPPTQCQKTTESHRWGGEGLGVGKGEAEVRLVDRLPERVLEGLLKVLHPTNHSKQERKTTRVVILNIPKDKTSLRVIDANNQKHEKRTKNQKRQRTAH